MHTTVVLEYARAVNGQCSPQVRRLLAFDEIEIDLSARSQETHKRMRDKAAHACRALCRTRVAGCRPSLCHFRKWPRASSGHAAEQRPPSNNESAGLLGGRFNASSTIPVHGAWPMGHR